MSTEAYEDLEDEFNITRNALNHKLRENIPNVYGEERKKQCREVEKILSDGNILIQNMENELRRAPAVYRNQAMTRIRGYKKDLDKASRELRDLKSGFGVGSYSERTNLLESSETDHWESEEKTHRARMMQGTQALERASAGVQRAQIISAETDQIGVEIIDELGNQRESLLRTKDRLHDTDAGLSKSRTILKSMARRLVTNKLILIIIILLELGVLGGVVYLKFFKKK